MTENILNLTREVLGVIGWVIILFAFALTLGLPHRSKVLPGSSGHRPAEESGEDEEIRADGYIDSFAGEIEEAGGGMPAVVKLLFPTILLWWLLYLILYWAP